MFPGPVVGVPHAPEDGLRDDHARYFIGEELGVARRHQRPDPGDDGNPYSVDLAQEALELRHVEHRLRDGKLGSGLDLVHETPQLHGRIDGGRVASDADGVARRFADGVAAGIEAVIQVVDQIGQADRVDVEDGGRVRVGAHLRRVPGNEQDIPQPHRRGA